MSIPSAAYKVPLLTVLSALGANMPGAQELVEKFEQAVRDECLDESEQIRAKVNHCPGRVCNVCPIDGTGYCP